MSYRMLIDAAHQEETRVVVQSNQQITEFDFESENKRPLRGNVYLAKVTRVEPSLQAAFVDYGGNRHGFLAFSEIHPDYYQIPLSDRELLLEEHAKAEKESADDEDDSSDKKEDASDEDEAEAVESVGGDAREEAVSGNRARSTQRKYKIQEVIKRRQVLLIQVVKEERGNKGAALTTYLSLAGRYCVLMPNTARGGGISRKINNIAARKKLKKIVSGLDVPDGMGLIIRTAGSERTTLEIKRDYKYLTKTWENVRDLTLQSSAPALVYEEGSLIRRCIRDLYNKDYEEVVVDGESAYQEAREYMKLLMPSHAKKVKLHKSDQSLFKESGVEDQLVAMFSSHVNLPSGGYLIIDQAEALVAIDVNSGRSTNEFSIEKTAVNTNLEAAEEVARQMRLRDLAGLLVIDFIDMDDHRNNRAVEKKLKDALKNDRARIQVGRISPFGLLEMSRQRMRSGVVASSSQVCSHCQGSGMIRSVESRALHILRHLSEQASKFESGEIQILLPSDVAIYLLNQKRRALQELEDKSNLVISVLVDTSLTSMEMIVQLPNQSSPGEAVRMDAVPEVDRSNQRNQRDRRGRNNRNKKNDSDRNANTNEKNETSRSDADPSTQAGEDDGKQSSERHADRPLEDGERPRRRRRGRRGGRNRRNDEQRHGEAATSEETASETTATSPDASQSVSVNEIDIAAKSADFVTNGPVTLVSSDAPAQTASDASSDTADVKAGDEDTKPKRKPRRRKKADTSDTSETPDTSIAADADAASETSPVDTLDEKTDEAPKPKRAPRKRATKAKVEKADKLENSDKADDSAADSEAKPVEKPKARKPRVSKAKSETKANPEDGLKTQDLAVDAAKAEETPVISETHVAEEKPKRGGWWRRST